MQVQAYGRRFVGMLVITLLTVSMASSGVAQEDQQREDRETVVFYLQHANSQEAYRLVMELMHNSVAGNNKEPASQLVAVPDDRTNSLIVSGNKDDIRSVEALLKLLDKEVPQEQVAAPAHNVTVDIFWIADIENSTKYEESVREIPADLKELVTQKLSSRLGLNNPRLVTTLMVKSLVSPSGRIKAERVGRSGEQSLMLSASGSISPGQGDQYAMSLNLQVGTDESNSGVDATFLIKPGKPMCLAVAETGPLNSVFIVRVREEEE